MNRSCRAAVALAAATLFFPGISTAEKVRMFPLSDVKLLDSQFKRGDDLNVEVLLKYDVDRLLAPYLKEAGLQPKAQSYSNWDGLDGHVGGHYLSALALAYASTGNEECKRRADYMVDELKRCHDANGNGYVGGVPGSKEMWENVKNGDGGAVASRWVPWYNVHKMYAGLLDAWKHTGNEDARKLFLDFCDWGIDVISGLDNIQMEKMLDTEFGGMNESYADAYELTGDSKYLEAAKRFSHKRIFDNMAHRTDNLDNMHANTQVPKAVGYQRVAELTGDPAYTTAGEFFWETVTGNRSLSIGGNSRREHFPSAKGCVEYTEEREGPESCNTYNMLKLTEGLFRMQPQGKYADFYERALYNHIRSTQHPGHGGYVYFTSARPRHYRVYSQPNQAMWCCVGTGMENHGKYGEFIYAHGEDDVYVNLFIPSKLDWKDKGISLTQTTQFPEQESTRLSITVKKPKTFTLKIRRPGWLADAPSVKINGKAVANLNVGDDSYISITRKWKNGDVVEMEMPMAAHIEKMPNVPDFISVIYGPVVLASRHGSEDLAGLVADDGRWSHIAHGTLLPLSGAPVITGTEAQIAEKLSRMTPVDGKPLHFTVPGLFAQKEYASLELEPFAGIHDSRYSFYWQSMTDEDYTANLKKREEDEKARLELDRRTVDLVILGEQQPEADHRMKEKNTFKGNAHDESFRGINKDGFLSLEMAPAGNQNLTVDLRVWGDEQGDCGLTVSVEGKEIGRENLSGKWNEKAFRNLTFAIPEELVEGKDNITLTIAPISGNRIPGIYEVRLLRK